MKPAAGLKPCEERHRVVTECPFYAVVILRTVLGGWPALSGFVSLLWQALVEMGVDSMSDDRLVQVPSTPVKGTHNGRNCQKAI